MTLTCSVCGTVNPQGTTYCDGCGVELTHPAVPAPAAPSPASEVIVGSPTSEGSVWDLPLGGAPPAPGEDLAPPAVVPTALGESPSADTPIPGTGGAARLGLKRFGAPTGEFIPLAGERLVVGRFDASSGPVDIDVSGMPGAEHISRRHAELYREGGRWVVRDLGSTNGVYLKRAGQSSFTPRLQEPTPLADGDELAFGNLMLTFHQD
ncbi:hypothetical protein RDMS_08075 [Deinococcus sp. RL]|uniref:FHA domain-containing protein n=1 Tax=Deinococcus sp. RL TaxID=1489678 RepID=UPI0004D5FCB0|nr:FHA domain-containing protein [Deinococcus sp. RL]KEF34346.1 hypothetical protein RDMS_08075 [Deinococcus sp. RL]